MEKTMANVKYLILLLFIYTVHAENRWKDSPYNWQNNKFNWDNSAFKWENSPLNYNNSPLNWNSNRIIRDTQGIPKGYAVPKLKGFNYFNLDGAREGYLNE